jgi:hypothetical protein
LYSIWGIAGMSRKQVWLLYVYIFVFLGLLAMALWLQSENYIYAASVMPILIVLALPDLRRNQYIRSRKDHKAVRIYRSSNEEDPLLVIAFQPDFLQWNNKKLYFHLNDIEASPEPADSSSAQQASLAVLAFDLSPHPRKTGWIGIDLKQLALRTANLPYTTDEITRLVIPMRDLEEAAVQMMASAPAAPVRKAKKSISA